MLFHSSSNVKILYSLDLKSRIKVVSSIKKEPLLNLLAPELLIEIVSYLTIEDLVNIAQSHSRYAYLISDPYIINMVKIKNLEDYHDRLDILEIILKYRKDIDKYRFYKYFNVYKYHLSYGFLELLIKYKKDFINKDDLNIMFAIASANGQLDIIKLLVRTMKVSPVYNSNTPIIRAAANGRLEVVQYLLKNKRVNPADNNNKAIIEASKYGHAVVVALLLTDPRVDPSFKNDEALKEASKNGHTEVVRLLLADPRVQFSKVVILRASSYGWIEILELLLADERSGEVLLDISWQEWEYSFRMAIEENYLEIVKILLSDSRINLGLEHIEIISMPIEKGNIEMTKLLLADSRIDPTIDGNDALYKAIYGYHIEIVRLLLADPRIDPNQPYYLIVYASLYAKPEIYNLLLASLRQPRVNPVIDYKEAIRSAIRLDHTNIVDKFLNDDEVNPKHLDLETFLNQK